jgi:hypothetical protein
MMPRYETKRTARALTQALGAGWYVPSLVVEVELTAVYKK